VEILGHEDGRIDAELILMLIHFLKSVGLKSPRLEINSLGCPSCRPSFRESILQFLQGKENDLCDDCRRRIKKNPLRVFDCKFDGCKQIIAQGPIIQDFLCGGCRNHFDVVLGSLAIFDIDYAINPRMVRGLDYYARTTFEITTEFLGAQNAIVGGGRYDGLVRDLGGPDIPGIGFAIGFERLLAMMPAEQSAGYIQPPSLFIAALGAEAQIFAYQLCNRFRTQGIQAEMDYTAKGLKSQMKRADRLKCQKVLIIGEREIDSRQADLRDMQTGEQLKVNLDDFEELSKHVVLMESKQQ
jgi:histidyl-tRNA synthetase